MLRELHIKNFAIIDDLHLTLEPGFNILTGETGAGKSILIDAVALILGGRADTSAVRKGAKRARVEGLFVLPPTQRRIITPILEREGLEGDEPDALWLSRELRSSGRTVARVNGRVVSLSLMREITERLVDVHGQSEHLSLLRVKEHLNLLDSFASLEDLRADVSDVVRELQAVRRELKHLRQSERERMQRIDLLRFQVDEIQSASLKPGEQTELEAELVRLANAEELTSLVAGLLTLLEESSDQTPCILDLVGQGQRDLKALTRIDATLSSQAQTLTEVSYQLEDLVRTLRDYAADIEFNPRRLTWVEDRLAVLKRLERKYGGNAEAILTYAQAAMQELQTLEHSDERIAELVQQEQVLLKRCATQCQTLSQKRQQAVTQLSAGIEAELNDLRMEGARVGMLFKWRAAADGVPVEPSVPGSQVITRNGVEATADETLTRVAFDNTGMDQVEFLVAPNIGEGLKPMTRIASGGETARLMLAIKTVLSRADRTPTLIFDEIDQGIGGRVGSVVGAKLWRLTANADAPGHVRHQVLCITHLPQLASFGDSHFRVQKHIENERTTTQVLKLDQASRIDELAQMLGMAGEPAREGAVEILNQAGTLKQNSKAVETAQPSS